MQRRRVGRRQDRSDPAPSGYMTGGELYMTGSEAPSGYMTGSTPPSGYMTSTSP